MSGSQAVTHPDEIRHGNHVVHPRWVRVTHWINALAALIMMFSGWRIYDESPLFPGFEFPEAITLGRGLAGALRWHFAAMWLLAINGLLYLSLSLITGRLKAKFLPAPPRAVFGDLRAFLAGKLSHADPTHYNAVQKITYLFVIADLVVLVLSGLVMWKPVQFPLLRTLMFDYENARLAHFFAMSLMGTFVSVHLAMAAGVPRSLRAMLCGR